MKNSSWQSAARWKILWLQTPHWNHSVGSHEAPALDTMLNRDSLGLPIPARRNLVIVRIASMLLVLSLHFPSAVAGDDWSQEQISKLPSGESPVLLFNGTTGSHGHACAGFIWSWRSVWNSGLD